MYKYPHAEFVQLKYKNRLKAKERLLQLKIYNGVKEIEKSTDEDE